jgi:hypothetical protein
MDKPLFSNQLGKNIAVSSGAFLFFQYGHCFLSLSSISGYVQSGYDPKWFLET